MAIFNVENGSIANYRLPRPRTRLDKLVKEALVILEEQLKVPDINEDFDSIMDIFDYLKRLSIGHNERLILSSEKLASFLLFKALKSGRKINDKGGIAHFMIRHASWLVFCNSKTPSLSYIYVSLIFEKNHLEPNLDDGQNKLDLKEETVKRLYKRNFDFTGQDLEKTVLNTFKKVIRYGFLPLYVDTYLKNIDANEEQKTPEFKEAMIEYLLSIGLDEDQYGELEDPWSDSLKELENRMGQHLQKKVKLLNNKIDKLKQVNAESLAMLERLNGELVSLKNQLNSLENRSVIAYSEIYNMTALEAGKFHEVGVNTFAGLAAFNKPKKQRDKYKSLLEKMEIQANNINSTWPQQAEFIMNGDHEKLEELVEALKNPPVE